jgi:hypothetical protein
MHASRPGRSACFSGQGLAIVGNCLGGLIILAGASARTVLPDINVIALTPLSGTRRTKPSYPQGRAARPSDGISIYGLPMMCRWAERVPAHIIYAPVSL